MFTFDPIPKYVSTVRLYVGQLVNLHLDVYNRDLQMSCNPLFIFVSQSCLY